ncbi:MAG: MarR family transcriptional regulator [Haloarculaceae archaeon]
MKGALEEIGFLANSANRFRVLGALSGDPASRRDLQEETGVPRSTAARVLDDAEDRGWVDSEGSRYWLTSAGEARVSAFREYVATTEGMRHLGKAIEWLPEPARSLDFRHLRGARITTPTEANPTAHFDRGMELLRAAEAYRGLTQNSLPQYMTELRDRVVRDELDFQGVLERGFVDVLGEDPERAALWRDIADRMWLYDGHVPLNMHVVDGTALIWLCDENHDGEDVIVQGLLESTHPAVVSWAESLYEEFRDESAPMESGMLPSE